MYGISRVRFICSSFFHTWIAAFRCHLFYKNVCNVCVVYLLIQEEKEEDEAPSDRGKEEWACGLLSLSFWRDYFIPFRLPSLP